MDLRLLEIFCRVYQKRSFSRAAEEIGLTQPTVSVHIRDLEESLGTPVFNRLGREIEPTEAGDFLYAQAKPLIALKRKIIVKMTEYLDRVGGLLTIGASSVPGERLLPDLIVGFQQRYPSAKTRLRISDTAETIDEVRHGEIDLGVVGGKSLEKDLLFESFATDSLVLAVPSCGPWQGCAELTLADLRKVPLLVRESGSGTRAALENALSTKGVKLADLHVLAEIGSASAIRQAMKRGCGAAFVSRASIDDEVESGDLHVVRIQGLDRVERTYYTVFHRKRVLTPLARAFLECLREHSLGLANVSGGEAHHG